MSFLKVIAIFCFLHLAFGVEFAHARPLYSRMEAKAGSKLEIPCVVTTDHLSGASRVGFEWGMTPEGGGPYKPIMHRNINLQKKMKRFYLRLPYSNKLDCTLAITPVLKRDSGTYEVHLTVDNVQRQPFKKVIVHVTDPTSAEASHTETVRKHEKNLEIFGETPSVTEEIPTMSPTMTTVNFFLMKNKGLFQLVGQIVGACLLILMAIGAACYIRITYYKGRPNNINRMEEGSSECGEEWIFMNTRSIEMEGGFPVLEEVLAIREGGDAEGENVLAVMEERHTAKDEGCPEMKGGRDIKERLDAKEEELAAMEVKCIAMEEQLAAMEVERSGMETERAGMEELLAGMEEKHAGMEVKCIKKEKELAAMKDLLTVREKMCAVTEKLLTIMDARVAEMERVVIVKEKVNAAMEEGPEIEALCNIPSFNHEMKERKLLGVPINKVRGGSKTHSDRSRNRSDGKKTPSRLPINRSKLNLSMAGLGRK